MLLVSVCWWMRYPNDIFCIGIKHLRRSITHNTTDICIGFYIMNMINRLRRTHNTQSNTHKSFNYIRFIWTYGELCAVLCTLQYEYIRGTHTGNLSNIQALSHTARFIIMCHINRTVLCLSYVPASRVLAHTVCATAMYSRRVYTLVSICIQRELILHK